MKILGRNLVVLSLTLFAGVALQTIGSPVAPTAGAVTKKWKLVWQEQFNGTAVDPSRWTVLTREPQKPNTEQYGTFGVGVKNGRADIVSRRHCVTPADPVPTYLNRATGVCPPGTTTDYSAGRIETPPIFNGDFKVVFRAKLPPNARPGSRAALWLKNETPYCIQGETATGEFDVMEWYSADPTKTTATSHIYCINTVFDVSYHKAKFTPQWLKQWHTFSITFQNNTMRYYVDDQPVKVLGGSATLDTKRTFTRTTTAQYLSVLRQNWSIVISSSVAEDPAAKSASFRAPDTNAPFEDTHFLVSDVKVYQ